MLNLLRLGELVRGSMDEMGLSVTEIPTRLSCERRTLCQVSSLAGSCSSRPTAFGR